MAARTVWQQASHPCSFGETPKSACAAVMAVKLRSQHRGLNNRCRCSASYAASVPKRVNVTSVSQSDQQTGRPPPSSSAWGHGRPHGARFLLKIADCSAWNQLGTIHSATGAIRHTNGGGGESLWPGGGPATGLPGHQGRLRGDAPPVQPLPFFIAAGHLHIHLDLRVPPVELGHLLAPANERSHAPVDIRTREGDALRPALSLPRGHQPLATRPASPPLAGAATPPRLQRTRYDGADSSENCLLQVHSHSPADWPSTLPLPHRHRTVAARPAPSPAVSASTPTSSFPALAKAAGCQPLSAAAPDHFPLEPAEEPAPESLLPRSWLGPSSTAGRKLLKTKHESKGRGCAEPAEDLGPEELDIVLKFFHPRPKAPAAEGVQRQAGAGGGGEGAAAAAAAAGSEVAVEVLRTAACGDPGSGT